MLEVLADLKGQKSPSLKVKSLVLFLTGKPLA
jgi:hypothetical protein